MQPQTQLQSVQTQTKQRTAAELLEEILEKQPTERYRVVDRALGERVSKLEELLPDKMKGQGERLVKRAMLTFSKTKSANLQKCTPASFIRCVLEAAELGLAIDGRLAHAVPYGTDATFQIDYKGLVQVAKRAGSIKDCYADVVYPSDTFSHRRENGQSFLVHTYDLDKERTGTPLGAYAIVTLPDGDWRYELMNLEELNRIRGRSKTSSGGPWVTDTNEMRKKTVIKRALKLYCDDPAIVRALELDDEDYEASEPPEKPKSLPLGRSNLRDRTNGEGGRQVLPETPSPVTGCPEECIPSEAGEGCEHQGPQTPAQKAQAEKNRADEKARSEQDPTAEEMEKHDTLLRLKEKIREAKTADDMAALNKEMMIRHGGVDGIMLSEWLGEKAWADLMDNHYTPKAAEVQGQKPPRKASKQKEFA